MGGREASFFLSVVSEGSHDTPAGAGGDDSELVCRQPIRRLPLHHHLVGLRPGPSHSLLVLEGQGEERPIFAFDLLRDVEDHASGRGHPY